MKETWGNALSHGRKTPEEAAIETCLREGDRALRMEEQVRVQFKKSALVLVASKNKQCSVFQEDINQSKDTRSHAVKIWTLGVQYQRGRQWCRRRGGMCVCGGLCI